MLWLQLWWRWLSVACLPGAERDGAGGRGHLRYRLNSLTPDALVGLGGAMGSPEVSLERSLGNEYACPRL